MNKLLVLLLTLCALGGALSAQGNREIFLAENFGGGNFPPTGWTISSHASNWSVYAGGNAGGSAPELRFSWTPQFNDSSYFVSPEVNTAGLADIYIDFRQYADHYLAPYTLGLVTRSGGGPWNTVWSASPTDDVGPELRSVHVTNSDVGSTSFQFAFFFSGNSYNIDFWYIDDIKLYTPFPYDLALMNMDLPAQVTAGTPFVPSCMVKNVGLNTLTATVSLEITRAGVTEVSYPDYFSAMLDAGQYQPVAFPVFTPSVANDLYSFHFSVSSLEDVVDNDLSNNSLDGFVNTWTGDRQMVVLEIGTGAWCQYCPGAAMAAEDFIDGAYNVAVIENHNGDPYATDISNGRNTYYGISGFPTGFFDGVLSYVGGDHTNSVFPEYLPLYEARNSRKTPLSLEIYGQQTREDYNLTFVMHKLAPIPYQNTVFHVAVTESDILYDWQDQDHLSYVNRMMYPGLEGTPWDLSQGEPGSTQTLHLSIAKDPSWVTMNCELVAFFQNLDTKEIIQANKVMLADLIPSAADDGTNSPLATLLKSVSPNPFATSATIAYFLRESRPVSLKVYNIKGQLVRTLISEPKEAGVHNAVWDGLDQSGAKVANGAYIVKLQSGSEVSTRRVIHLQ